jgi:hypothetical protein
MIRRTFKLLTESGRKLPDFLSASVLVFQLFRCERFAAHHMDGQRTGKIGIPQSEKCKFHSKTVYSAA